MNELDKKVIASVIEAYSLGRSQESNKRLKKYELLEQIDWVRGIHKNLIWTAYKSGLYENKGL